MGLDEVSDDKRYSTDLYRCAFVQSRQYMSSTWSIVSLDLILGLVGGVTSIIWTIFSILIGPYESFKFQASLIGSVYPTSPQPDEDEEPDIQTRKEA